MPLRSRVYSVAGFAAFLSLCAGGVGCQSTSLGVMHTETASQPVRDYIRGLTSTKAPPTPVPQGTVIASSRPIATLARPTAPAPLPGGVVGNWEPVQRVKSAEIASSPSSNHITRVSTPPQMGGAVRAALDIPVPQPAAIATTNGPNDPPPTPLKQPRLEPQAIVAAPPVVFNHPTAPHEFAKQPLPPYVVEPPDILLVSLLPTLALTGAPVEGTHLVRPDGTIGIGVYGSVYVAGLTLDEVRDAVANQLHVRLDKTSVEDIKKGLVVDVAAYNSKVYYVITDGGGYGEQVYQIPVTGNETVLDAIAKINGLPAVSSKKRIWIARATPGCTNPNILPVDWCGVSKRGYAATNYQIFPNDRIYVDSDKLIRTDSWLAKRLNPIDRVLGTVLLSSSTVNSIKNGGNGTGNTGQ
jgi:protein involved in polysaccharide export with SLBB domain